MSELIGLTPSPKPTQPGSADTSGAASEHIFDVGTQDFMPKVIQASREVPVLVDFWAPWCGPCKQLTPIIEAAVAKAGGQVKLAKMNIDEHPAIPGQMGIQSIPAVVAFVDGQPKDGFMGAQGPQEVEAFIEKLIGGPLDASGPEKMMEEAAKLFAAADYEQAGALYAHIAQGHPTETDAMIGMAHATLKLGDPTLARELMQQIEGVELESTMLDALVSDLALLDKVADLGDPAALQARLDTDPADYQAAYDLALIKNALGDKEAATDLLIGIIKADREWNDDGARTQLLELFESWGFADPASVAGRRKLSALLFS